MRERADLVPVISDLTPHYERWAQEWLGEARCASAFAGFIVKPAARAMLMPGVRWLLDNAKRWREDDWQVYHLTENLTSVAHHIWLNYREGLEKDEGMVIGMQTGPTAAPNWDPPGSDDKRRGGGAARGHYPFALPLALGLAFCVDSLNR